MRDIRSDAQDGDNLRLVREHARLSRDPSTQVGGMLLLQDGTRVMRHNEFLTLEDPATATREERYADVIHAEEALLLELEASRAHGSWYYGTHEPCGRCWKLLAMAGIERVVFYQTDPERRERWGCNDRAALKARDLIQARGGVKVAELR